MITRRDFLKATAATLFLAPAMSYADWWPCAVVDTEYLGPCLRQVKKWTTMHKTIVPLATECQRGESPLVRDELLHNGHRDLGSNPRSLLFFGHFTDAHVVDEESPGRLVAAEPYLELIGVKSAFHPQENLTLQVMDAMMRTFNKITDSAPLQFMLNTGDTTDNAHEIELQWVLNALEGREVDPDSGTDQDPIPGPHNDANDPFVATGLRSSIPYYNAIGNHDVLLQGNIPNFLRGLYNSIVQKYLKCMYLYEPTGNFSNAVITPWATPPEPEQLKPGNIIPDARRRAIIGQDIIKAHLQYLTQRPVLGFPKELLNRELGYYSFKPQGNIPIRVVVLDTTCRLGTALGVIDEEQYSEFLIPQLDEAKAQKELVIVASHHPSGSIVDAGQFRETALATYRNDRALHQIVQEAIVQPLPSQAYVTGESLNETLKSYSNVILHVAGHTHSNSITPIGQTGRGYWEVVTSALLSYPQQSRLFEIVYEGDGVGAIHTCVVDHESESGSLAAYSRQLAYEDEEKRSKGTFMSHAGNTQDRNAILRFTIPSEIAARL